MFVLLAPFVGRLFGLFPMDLTGGEQFLALGSLRMMVLAASATLPLWSLPLAPFVFGEKWGWRGYLLPQLLPLGR